MLERLKEKVQPADCLSAPASRCDVVYLLRSTLGPCPHHCHWSLEGGAGSSSAAAAAGKVRGELETKQISNDPHGSSSVTARKVRGELETTRQKIILTRCPTTRLGASSVAAGKVRSEIETRQIIMLTRCPTTHIGSSSSATAGKVRREFETTKQIIILTRCPATHM